MSENNPRDGLFDQFDASMARRQRLMDKATHKALDIPYEGDGVRVNTTTIRGIGWKELAVIGSLILGLGGLGLGFQAISHRDEPSELPCPVQMQPAATAPAPAVSPLNVEYEIQFFDAQGKPIHVEQLPTEGIGNRSDSS